MTVVGTAAPAVRVPWCVPVRIVPMPPVGIEQQVHRVDPCVALPGVRSVDVVTVRAPGSAAVLLTEIRPVRTTDAADSGTDGTLAELLATLLDDDADDADDAAVTVAVDGTTFTRDALAALARVPVGARRMYAQLAADAGRPRAVRAVASVMARNRVPLVLPCHRIVPSGGGTGRYGWGDAIKVALLDAESHSPSPTAGPRA